MELCGLRTVEFIDLTDLPLVFSAATFLRPAVLALCLICVFLEFDSLEADNITKNKISIGIVCIRAKASIGIEKNITLGCLCFLLFFWRRKKM